MNPVNRNRRLLGPALSAVALPAFALLILAQPSLAHATPAKGAAKGVTAKKAESGSSWPTGLDSSMVSNLKHGGYVIFFRHAMTNWNERDVPEADFSNRALQRNLSEAGQREASVIGQSIRVLEIPIEKVLASPMWRCRDTAQFAFGDYDTTSLLFWKGPTFREARIKVLSTSPAAGKNLVLIGHQDQLIPIVPGLKRDQLQEGDALVFQPLGGGKYKAVRQVTPFDWARFAGVEPPVAEPAPPKETEPSAADSLRGSKAESN